MLLLKTIGLQQGWASFSHDGPDLEKLLKPRAARWLENKGEDSCFFGDHGPRTNLISKKKVFTSFYLPLLHRGGLFFENHCYP